MRLFRSVFIVCAVWLLTAQPSVANAGENYDPLKIDAASVPEPIDLTVHDATRDRDIPIRVYLPAAHDVAPVVLFSHGLGGSRAGSAFLGRHWAGRGYVAVFTQHPGSDEALWKDEPIGRRMEALSQAASLANFLLRVRDVPAVLDQLAVWNADAKHPLRGRLDLKKVGMSGHSFGAITTQAVSGETFPLSGQRLTDPRIRAAIVMSPSTPHSGRASKAFGNVKIPWLLMTGTKDLSPVGGIDMASRLGVYPALQGASKYEVVLHNAEHSVFIEHALPGDSQARNPNHRRVILALSTAFWDAYLRDDKEALAWLNSEKPRQLMEPEDKWQFQVQ